MNGRHTFPDETLAALFDAVEMNDVVDPIVSLPDPIPTACSQEDMRRCLGLCVQFWREGAIRGDVIDLIGTLLRTGDLPAEDRVRFKHIRARYKQLRFALTLYGAPHRAPLLFRSTVAVMGHLQDAFRNRQRGATVGYSVLLRLLMSWPLWKLVRREIDTVPIDSPERFLAFRRAEFARLRTWLDHGAATGHRFHAMRKVVSRQVSFYDTMRTLRHDDAIYRMSRFLSAINGLMGSMHDDLVEQAIAGHRDYNRDRVPLPEDIRDRLETLTHRYVA